MAMNGVRCGHVGGFDEEACLVQDQHRGEARFDVPLDRDDFGRQPARRAAKPRGSSCRYVADPRGVADHDHQPLRSVGPRHLAAAHAPMPEVLDPRAAGVLGARRQVGQEGFAVHGWGDLELGGHERGRRPDILEDQPGRACYVGRSCPANVEGLLRSDGTLSATPPGRAFGMLQPPR